MMKRIIALLLALILTVGLLPTVALAAEGDAGAATTSAAVKNGYYNNDTWTEGTITQQPVPGVQTVSKTAKPTTNANEYEVTLKVVLKQTEENSGKAATVLVLDTSGSMAYCAECGAEPDEDCEHNYVPVLGTPSETGTYYYKYTNKSGQVGFMEAHYCNGRHTFQNEHAAGWFKTRWYESDHNTQGDALSAKNLYIKRSRASRLDAAKVAAENFLKTYSGLTFKTDGTPADNQNNRNLGRYVSVVSFATKAESVQSWVDVSNSDVYKEVLKNIKRLNANGGTNLDAGLTYAEYLLKQTTVNDAVKNVIALTDGQPTFFIDTNERAYNDDGLTGLDREFLTIDNTTYRVHGTGDSCNAKTFTETVASADAVKNHAKLYTVCFDADETIGVPNSEKQITVSEYLSTKIATQSTKAQFAYDASNAEQLYAEFAKITQSIVSGLNNGTVRDTLPTGITSEAFGEDNVKEWKLNEKPFTKNETTNTVDGKQVTTYTYTYTYTVTINPLTVEKTKIDGAYYAPLNGETTLTVKNGDKNVTIHFPIPAGKVTMPSHTVTWKSQDGNTTLETDNNVEYNTKPSFDQADPTKADDAQYTYTFVGWATEANREIGTPEANLPAVTADVTYYAAFSKTPRTYTVTWMPQDGQGNAYETDTGVAYNARPSYDGTEPTKAADAEHTYTFVGWATSANQETGTLEADLPAVTADVTYYAAFSKTPRTYTVTFKDGANGEVFVDETQQVEYGKNIPSHDNPVRPGYNFTGWTSEPANYQPGTGTMPANNITFTAQWTEKGSVTISYVAKEGGSVDPSSETLNPDTGTAVGSTAAAGTGYTFDGWYSDSECTEAKKVGGQATFIPIKPTTGWVDGTTFYAKFTKNTYTVTYTDGVNGTAFENQSTPDVAYGAPIPAFNGTPTRAGYNFTGWTSSVTGVTTSSTMPDSDVTFTAGWTPKSKATINYEVVGPANCGSVTPENEEVFVDAEKASGSTATAEPNYRFVGWYSDSECTEANKVSGEVTFTPPKPDEGGWVTTTYYAKFVPSTVTFDLNTLITKTFEKDPTRESKDIPTGTYIFTAQIFEADDTWQQVGGIPVYTGTATLNGAASGAAFDFGSSRNPTLASGTHRYLVKEEHGGETIDGITYDSTVYRLTITVSEDGTQPNVQIEAEPQASVLSVQSVEFTSKIIFTNTYFEEKDPNALYLDFSKYVQKELTATGSKTASDVKFRVIVNGMESPIMMYNAGEEEVSTYVEFNPRYRTVLDVNFASITGGNTETKDFTGSYVEIDQVGIYYFELNEEDGKRTGVTYDDSTYKVYVYVKREGDKLVVDSFDIYKDGWSVAGETITFHNTIDTGRDDYIPIIIPTIINKDTGMLNKTDHFAYVIGYPDGTVHPNGQITRAEVATIFFRLLRDEVRDGAFTTSNTYSDVAYGKWYNNPISTMSALGIITGYPDGTFKPNKPITRAEFAAIAARFDETQSGKSATFSDVIGHWAAKEIGIAYANEWIKGYPDGTFKPDQNITRAEAMTLINRVLERKPESPADLLTNMNKWTDNMDTSKWYYLDVQEATNSHAYTRKTFNYELWRQMLPDPDWSRYER